ncbi:serine hydrolase domain-containing protein [Chitinophaga flava]|uniref:Beta-lactamase-related domain-containing protein n=1 Tax=Chitinophaga flava TaxID=2259036 RepID=A0A365XUW2_9BACT|nr:serine hydrolase domain-containing protein [Chitinophaga flava]RBL90123.1 hypothetical protein DF182_27025 [Chitinophaga flava]
MRPYILLSMLILPLAVFSQSLQHRFDSVLQGYHQQGQLEGTVLVARQGKIVYTGQFGYANRQFKVPVTADTRFPIASISKMYTAIMVLQLQEEKKLDIDQPVSAYVPELLPSINARISLRQLLVHSSGLPSDKVPDYTTQSIKQPGAFIRNNVKDTLLFTPGSRFHYNNVDYILLGAVIEQVTGKKWGQVLQEKILTPLKLTSTGIVTQQDIIPKLAYGYHNYTYGPGTAMDTLHNDEARYLENYATAGGLYTTAAELFRVDQALYDGLLLQPASLTEMYTPVKELGFLKYARGFTALGSYVNRLSSIKPGGDLTVIERRGNILGFNSCLLRCVEDRNTVIVLCNTYTGNMEKIGDDILRILYNPPTHAHIKK